MTLLWHRTTATYSFHKDDAAPDEGKALYNGPIICFSGNKPGQISGPLYYIPRFWHNFDLKPFNLPAHAVWARGAAELIITESSPNSIDDLTCLVRPVGSSLSAGNYRMQATCSLNADGRRDVQPWYSQLSNGYMQLYWNMTVGGVDYSNQPANSGSGFLINMWLEQWGADAGDPDPGPDPDPPQTIVVPPAGLNLRFEQGT